MLNLTAQTLMGQSEKKKKTTRKKNIGVNVIKYRKAESVLSDIPFVGLTVNI